MLQAIQVIGAVLVLVAFAGAQFGRLDPHSVPYLLLNTVGAAVLAVLALVERQWGFLILQATWALVSVRSLISVLRAGG